LKKLKLWEKVQSHIVKGENITQAHQFVSTGNAELGFIPLSEVKNVKTGSMWIVPANLYSPIRQDAVILSQSKSKPGVKALFDYLKGKESKAIIKDFGYTLP
jgi:molybdate transport system substrate-binding protein